MTKVAVVSCDKWINKIEEDRRLKYELKKVDMDADIVSWQDSCDIDDYNSYVLRSVWGYQDYYKDFKNWLMKLREDKKVVINDVDVVLNNIDKEKQFDILLKNDIKTIDTYFVDNENFTLELLTEFVDKKIFDEKIVFKPTISGSGDNTFLYDFNNVDISFYENFFKLRAFLDKNKDSNVMVQPYISSISNGEYSCVFIDGKLTHTMLRFPGVFSDKKSSIEIEDVPNSVLSLANKVESIDEFKNSSYMRVDMVIDGDVAKIMEVELTDPDLLTRNLDSKKQKEVIKRLAKTIQRKIAES